MSKLMKNIKLMVGVSTMLVVLAVAPVVYGGTKWSGMDPILMIENHQFNVRPEWPSHFDCSFTGPIQITVAVPEGASVELLDESSFDLSDCKVETDTVIVTDSSLRNKVRFEAFFPSGESFDVKLKIDRDGELVAVYLGLSNQVITGKVVKFNGNDQGFDPVLPEHYDGTSYNYEDDQGEDGQGDGQGGSDYTQASY